MTYKHLNPIKGIIIANKKGDDFLAAISILFIGLTGIVLLYMFCAWKFDYMYIRICTAFYLLSLSDNFYYWKEIDTHN